MNDADMMNYKRPAGHRMIENSIDASAIIGDGSQVWWYARVLQEVRIGKNCSIGGGCEIGRGTVIGDDSRIGAGTFLPPNSIIGERVFIGPNVTFTDDMHPKVHLPDDPPYRAQPPIIEDDAAIGAGAVIVPGTRIGAGARIAAGSVVTRDVVSVTLVQGNPARARLLPEAWDPTAPMLVVTSGD